MAYAPSTIAARELAYTEPPVQAGRGWFRRLLSALMESRQRQADREIARYLAGSGGRFTDETEREIERRFLSTPTRWWNEFNAINSELEIDTMSTLPLRISHVQPLNGFARVFSVIVTVFEVFAEAQQQAIAAHQRYPFIDRWAYFRRPRPLTGGTGRLSPADI
jgi:hypothetical protein